MTAHELTLSIGDLDSGGREYVFPLRSAWIRGILEGHEATAADSDGKLAIRASKSGVDVVVHGTLEAALSVPCARCLQSVKVEVSEPVSVLFAPRNAGHARAQAQIKGKGKREIEELELTPEEADTLPYDGETVVLDDLVRDELILETPNFPLCSEDCPGISPSLKPEDRTGASPRDPDPRLLPLRRLIDRKE
jgi:uncharacterized protein